MDLTGICIMRAYQIVIRVAAVVGSTAFGVVVLASFGYAPRLEVGDLSLWPLVIGSSIASVFAGSWAYAKSKGRSGWLGLLAPFLDVFGLKLLERLEMRKADSRGKVP